MKVHIFVLLIGIILGGLVALPFTALASSWSLPFMVSENGQAQDTQGGQGHAQEPSETHQRMHEMMDAIHREGTSRKMHEAMPGSEEMMEECARRMEDTADGHMMGGFGMMESMMDHSGHER